MRLPRLVEICLVLAAFVAAWLLVEQPWIDVFFAGVLLSSLLLLGRYVLTWVIRSHRAHRREREVVAVDPAEAAQRAVEEERGRLVREIDRSVRRSLIEVRALSEAAHAQVERGGDPRDALIAMQVESRAAMAELRRQLGLIAPEPSAPRAVEGAPPAMTAIEPMRPRPSRADVVLTVAVLVLIAVENIVYPVPGASWAMSSAMALTLLGRRVAPTPIALAGASILLLGVVLGAAVADGFAFPIVVGLLLWSVLECRPGWLAFATAIVLFGAAIGSRWAHDPDNGPLNVVLLSVVSVGALIVGRSRRSRTMAETRALSHQADLEAARESAAEDTRRRMARELHDVVSHAVSLVAVQAGAAELAWPRDPAAARGGLHAIDAAVSAALSELDAQSWDDRPVTSWSEVERTVERLRDAGLQVRLDAPGERPPGGLLPVVHRLVQEALTNVLKHAEGATAYVSVISDADRTVVEVIDDGPGRVKPKSGYGLVGLEDRVCAVGGTLRIGPARDGGFEVRAVLPHEPAGLKGGVSA